MICQIAQASAEACRFMMLSRTAFVLVVLAIIMLAGPAYSGENVSDPCHDIIPEKLEQAIKSGHPGWETVTLRHLPEWAQEEYKTNRCPGAVKADFFGDARSTFAIALFKESRERGGEGGLFLAQLDREGRWTLTRLRDMGGIAWFPTVAPKGRYQDIYGKKTIQSKGEVIVLDLGQVAWLFAWTGDKIDYIWIKD